MDVRLYQKNGDGGEIEVVGGQIGLDEGLETAVFLSLFGGNDDDAGIDATKALQWWGNVEERDETRRHRSETQYLLNNSALVPANLRRFEDAAALDLEWMTSTGLASFVGVEATMPALNTVKLTVKIEIQGQEFKPAFVYRRSTQK
jgi:phage gp46-like protein